MPDRTLLLAPMEDITDPSFRFICKQCGADLVFTEFIPADGLIRKGARSLQKLDIYDFDRPVGIQLYGHRSAPILEAVDMAEKTKPEFIDLNFGCPVKKIARRGAGAGMLRNVPLMVNITRDVVRKCRLPVTVKTRLGWDEQNKNILDVALRLQDAGISAITIHGRTGKQLYKGRADWTLIGEVKNHPRMKIPVFGNGDVDSPVKAMEMFNRYGVDGVMIGRSAIGNPWLFKEIRHHLESGNLLSSPSIDEKVNMAKLHFSKSFQYKGVPRGILEMRRHFSQYFKGLPNFRDIRLRLLTSRDPGEINRILEEIRDKYGTGH